MRPLGRLGRLGRLRLSTPPSGGGAPPPVELFPDPTLADVADGTNGWIFPDGSPFFGPIGGVGPGIEADCNFFTTAELVGTDAAAIDAAVADNATVSVALTFSNFVEGSVTVLVKGGTEVVFAPSGNGVVTHSCAAGVEAGFLMYLQDGVQSTFDITHISVTAP